MNLFRNPFYILNVSTRDSKQKIIEAFDNRSLSIDVDLCIKARAILTHPRNRLSAELSWLQCISPKKSLDVIDNIETGSSDDIYSYISDLEPLTQCNILAAFITQNNISNSVKSSQLMLQIAKSFDEININDVLIQINEDRVPAGMPQINDVNHIETALNRHRKYFISVLHDVLNRVTDPDLVLAEIVNIVTVEGEFQAPLLIDELCDVYQLEVQKYLDQLYEKIQDDISTIKSNDFENSENISSNIDLLEKHLREWDQIAQPVQLIMKSRGLDDKHSIVVADEIRSLAVYLANEHGLHDKAKRIANFMSDIFKEIPEFSELVNNDINTLDDLIDKKKESAKEDKQWREERTLDVNLGTIFKKQFKITPEIISLKNDQIPTNEVDRVRWWAVATQHSINFISTGTSHSYNVWIGSPKKYLCIEPSAQNLYSMITDRLWKAVCVRILSKTLNDLSTGKHIAYGPAVVDKDGIMLQKRKFISSEPFYGKWEDLSISNGNGSFVVFSSIEKKAKVELKYSEYDNVHILETLMRFLWKDGNYAKLQRGEFSDT